MSALQLSKFDSLVDDVLLHLFGDLPLCDLLAIRQTCKRLSCLTKLRTIWYGRFSKEVLGKRLPIPGLLLSPNVMTADDLEWRTRRALQLDARWSLPKQFRLNMCRLPLEDQGVRQVVLLYGTSCALVVFADKVQLWKVDVSARVQERKAQLTGERRYPSSELSVARDMVHSNRVAVQSQDSIDVLAVGAGDRLVSLGHLDSPLGSLVGFYDQYLLLNTVDAQRQEGDVPGVTLVNWQSSNPGKCVLHHVPLYGKFINFTFFASHIVILWDSCLTIYPSPVDTDDRPPVIDPSQVFRWRHQIQAPAVVSPCRSRKLPEVPYPESPVDCLTIIANPVEHLPGWGAWGSFIHNGGKIRSVLYSADKGRRESFSLASMPLQISANCGALSTGQSGRGVWIEDGCWIRRCKAKPAVTGVGVFTVADCDDVGSPLCALPATLADCHRAPAHLDFDDGMGRVAVYAGDEVQILDFL